MQTVLENIQIKRAQSGLYKGLNTFVTLASKAIITALVLWAIIYPEQMLVVLNDVNRALLSIFNAYYVYVVTFFLIFCIGLALVPYSGKIRLGAQNEQPEFSNFSWFSMMFSAGMGIGLLVFATAEPLSHFANNPEIIRGHVIAHADGTVQSAFRYTFLHYGLHPWAIYVVTGLSMAYFSYARGLPLTIRSTLVPLFGNHLNGPVGHAFDITAIIATLLGVAVTVGYGVSQLIVGFYGITGWDWMMTATPQPMPTKNILVFALLIVMVLSTISAVTGVGRGIKYLSNLNLGLSCMLLLVFMIFGPSLFSLNLYGQAVLDYMVSLPVISFEVFEFDTPLGDWQEHGTILYWAWWIAFAPFVGLFLARISRGRTIREFVVGAMLAPAAMCFVWIVLLGGAAIHLELSGVAQGDIINAVAPSQLFKTMNIMLSDDMAQLTAILTLVLILSFLITSVDSGVLVLNTIMAGGEESQEIRHRIIWGVILTLVVGVLLIVGGGGLAALQKVMIIGALPFSLVMVLMCCAMIKAIVSKRA